MREADPGAVTTTRWSVGSLPAGPAREYQAIDVPEVQRETVGMVVGTVRKKYAMFPGAGVQRRRTDADFAKFGKLKVGRRLERLRARRQE